MQTNATLIDAQWASFLAEHDFLVGVSIDGPQEVHDPTGSPGRAGQLPQVMEGLAHLRDAGVEWNALTTVHAANAGRGREVYRFLRDGCGARFITHPDHRADGRERRRRRVPSVVLARPAALRPERRVGDRRSVSAAGYGRFLIDVFEEWFSARRRRDVRPDVRRGARQLGR